MSKTIVAHISPDLDAGAASWLLKRFRPGWKAAQMAFVPAGTTLNNAPADSDPEVAHVDTGLGIFDHHQFKDNTLSATKRVFQYLKKEGYIKKRDEPALERMVEFVTSIDNFGEVFFHDPLSDTYDFTLHQITEGFKIRAGKNEDVCEFVFTALDSIFQIMKQKIAAVEDMKKGFEFTSRWGRTIVMDTKNEEALKIALKEGYQLVVRRDPDRGFLRIKTRPDKELDLKMLYDKVLQVDPTASWFLHISHHMLLNGSSKNPKSVPSQLTLAKVIEIIKSF